MNPSGFGVILGEEVIIMQGFSSSVGIGQSVNRPVQPDGERVKAGFNWYAMTYLVVVGMIVASAGFWYQHGGQAYYWIGQKLAGLGL